MQKVGRVGIEPTWFAPGDFKSPASANSATAPNPSVSLIVHALEEGSRFNSGYIKTGNWPAGAGTRG